MADPLSIASGIGGLVTLTDLVFCRIFKYVQAVKGASKEISALSSEVGALYGILSSLQLVCQQLDPKVFVATTLRTHHINSCTQTLEKMRMILDKDSTSSLQTQTIESIKRKLRWPFSSSEVKILLAECERHKTALGLALKADSMSGLVQLLSNQDDIRDTVNEINTYVKQRHEADTRIAINEKRQSILNSFGTTDPSKNQKMGLKLRQPGTGLWLIESQEYRHWAQTDGSKLWLQGIPGAGKTVLAATVIEEILRESNSNHAVAFYYCDYKDSATQMPNFILGSLVQQIAKQDEESFKKVKLFCDAHNPEYKDNVLYDPQELRDLICNLTISFNQATIVVDGLDECGVNAGEVTELLASLNQKDKVTELLASINQEDKETNIKTLFLSRNEVEIREHLEDYAEIAIAARSSDLRLYVGAEMDARTRNHKLRIKDQSLKDYIMEKLVEGAEGMFRWVACQMDYLCELPNDSSRRKALGNLPPSLHATYERILRSVNARPKETQLLVSRTLRWIVHSQERHISNKALCEAVSINIGDRKRDIDSIPDEFEVLRWCSSLVRKGWWGPRRLECLELAHFTVKEFLLQLGDDDTGEFALYRVGPGHDKNDLAKVCLTYLNFCDFDQGLYINATVTNRRFNDYPFRRYAVHHWYDLARPQLADRELFLLAKQLLKPSKTGTLLSWLQDRIVLWLDKKMDDDDHWWLDEMNRAIAEATTLHFAAMLSLPEVCTWLIDSGDCDINRASGFGTPLHCSLMTLGGAVDQLFDKELFDPWESCRRMEEGEMEEQGRVFEILLAAGADPNCYQGTLSPLLSPLFLSLELWKFDTASQLIDKGARLDEHCLELLESVIDTIGENDLDYEIQGVIDRIQSQPVEARDYSRTLRLIDKFGSSGNATGMPGINKAKQFTKPEFESILRVAAEFGQMEVIDQILGGQSVDLRAAEEETGLTALHYAAMNDHLNVVKLLLSHGADPYEVDCNGKNAIHHAISSVGVRCLEHLVEKVSTDTLLDAQGLSLWHWAAVTQTKQALETLAKYSTPMPSLSSMRTKDGWPPLLSAASVGSTENIDWLLHAGCTTMDKAYDGSTALHLAARSGFSDAVRVLLRNGSEVNAVTNDGSTVLHFALLDLKEGISAVLKLLIGQGLDVSHARVDGVMPIHLLLSHCANMTLTYENGHDHGLSTPESGWLLEAFGILVSDTDLGRKNSAGKSTLHLLADTWQNLSLDLSSRGKSEPNYTATRMMHMALDCASLTENSQRVCANPGLTIAALTIQDEQLAYKFLKHLPDVDVVTGDSSIIKAACLNGCSFTLLQEVLSRSKIQSENKQVSGLVRAVCRAKATKSRHKFMKILMNAGLSPNDSCPSSGKTPLMIAAHDGNTELMKVLLSNGADIHALDMDGNNVAHYACMGGYLKAVQILKPSTVNWNKKGTFRISSVLFKGANPLHIAAAGKKSHVLEFLIDENLTTDIDVVTELSETALFIAAWKSRPLNVSLLLSKNANAVIKSLRSSVTPLHLATRLGYEAVVRVFLQHNCDINVLDGRGLDCEALAKKHGRSGVERILRDYREEQEFRSLGKRFIAAPRSINESRGMSQMLRVAIDLVDIEFCKRLANEGTSLSIGFDEFDGCSPLLYLLLQSPLGKDKVEMAEFLVLQGASIEGIAGRRWSVNWYTVFHFVAEFSYTGLLQILLDKYPSSIFELENTIHPLHLAVSNGNYECVQLIIHHCQRQHEINVSKLSPTPSSTGDLINSQIAKSLPQAYQDQRHDFLHPTILGTATPLQIATHCGHKRIAKFLLESGASPNKTDNNNSTPLHFAAQSDQTAMIELLLDQGANVHAFDRWLRTPSMAAAKNGSLASLQILKARGADFQMRDVSGKTVLHYAAEPPNTFIVPVLAFAGDENLGIEDCMGWSLLTAILGQGNWGTILSIINFAPKLGDYDPNVINVLSAGVSNAQMSTSLLKKFLRRLSPSIVTSLLKHRAKVVGTPLYVASTVTSPLKQEGFINLLLEAGADLEQLGGEHGTPLMGACAAGRLTAVKSLVGKGARLCYEGNDGLVSALNAARHFPVIVRWLLVERFTRGQRRVLGTVDA